MIIAVLVAALVVPWFVDWNAYRSTFEREAEKILGQPVRVLGTADASVIPMPSLTFTDVRVGGTPDKPMMRIERFSMRIELIPLLTGSFKVVDMSIVRPHVQITVDGAGTADWLKRSEASKSLDPDAVSLEKVDISDGTIDYLDTRSNRSLSLTSINAAVDARSLLGPWKVEGGLVANGVPTTFRIATGRREADRSIRVKIDANPASVPVAVSAEGPVAIDATGLLWTGAFSLTHVADDDSNPIPVKKEPGWRAAGAFELRPEQLRLPNVTLSAGPEDRPYSLTGTSTVDLGTNMRFDAVMKSRQIDFDRSIGKGPAAPANVDSAIAAVVNVVTGLPVPSIPGQVGFDIPGIIVGGSVIQNLRFDAITARDGWKIEELGADLPGRTRLTADGMVRTQPKAAFSGGLRLASEQPAIFAAWWRGGPATAQPPLRPFDMSGQVDITAGSVRVAGIAARMQESNIRGSLGWQRLANGQCDLAIDLKANRLDYDQITSLTELFAGRRLTDAGGLADNLSVKIATGALDVGDETLGNVTADGSYANGVLVVNRFAVADLAGASINATGRIADLSGAPNGQISASIEATDTTGLVAIVDRLWPGTRAAAWFHDVAPSFGPAKLATIVNASAAGTVTNANLTLNGTAGGTGIDVAMGFTGTVAGWRDAALKVSAAFENADAGQALRQFGYAALPVNGSGRLKLTAEGSGTLADGVQTQIKGEFAGLAYGMDGRIGVDVADRPVFHGTGHASGIDFDPALSLLLGTLPGLSDAHPLSLDAALDIEGASGRITFRDAKVGDINAGGSVALALEMGRWKLDGDVAVDQADLGFATGLALGLPANDIAGDNDTWSKTTFGRPVISGFDASLRLTADKLAIRDGLAVSNAALTADFSGERTELNLKSGNLAGGSVSGSLSIANPEGDASLSGQFDVKGATLSDLVWQKDGRSVADGSLDISGQFEGSGRSLSGAVSALSGGGSLRIGAGTARFINPEAFSAVIRASDAGREISEAELRKLFAGYLDAGVLAFQRVEGAFTIAAGTLRAQNIEVVSASATTVGGATVDLNQGTLDSQWTLTVDPGADKVSGAVPQVGLVFSGPLDAPIRKIDVAPLAGFLSVRSFEREVERIETLQAEILEKEKLGRLVRFARDEDGRIADAKAKADADRQAAEEAAAAKAEEARQAAELAAQQAVEKAAADAAAAKAAEVAKKAADAAAAAKAADIAKKAADAAARKAVADAAARKAAADAAARKVAADAAKKAADDARNAMPASPFPMQIPDGGSLLAPTPPANIPNP